MPDRHPTDDELSSHIETSDPLIDAHLARCSDCRERLVQEREFTELLVDRDVWDGALSLRLDLPLPLAQRQAFDRMQAERERAAELLAPILRSIDAFREADIERNRELHSSAAVHVLTKAANSLRKNDLHFAFIVATAAANIATKLTDRQISHASAATAWLERGIAGLLLSRYRDADLALDKAEYDYGLDDNATGWDYANVWLTRADVYVEMDRVDDAGEVAGAAAEAYLEYGDRKRHLRALMAKGSVLYTRGAFSDAIAVYDFILSALDQYLDEETYAHAQHNAAYCYLEMRDLDKAEQLFVASLAVWDARGHDAYRARAAWGLASVAIARGEFHSALAALDSTRRQLAALEMVNDEALVRLDMADVLLALGRPSDARLLLEGIAVQFASEGMMRNARIALAHAAEALRRDPVSLDNIRREIRHVREYLAQLPVYSKRPFAPLE